jgi:hypothetical protein
LTAASETTRSAFFKVLFVASIGPDSRLAVEETNLWPATATEGVARAVLRGAAVRAVVAKRVRKDIVILCNWLSVID